VVSPILELDHVIKRYPLARSFAALLAMKPRPVLKAVSDVSFAIEAGETFGLVGESGCGKSTLGRLIVGLGAPDGGHVSFQGQDIHLGSRRERRALHRQIQMVFQDPYASLNPRMTIGQALGEPLRVHGVVESSKIAGEVDRLLSQVGLSAGYAHRYPFELSGGQRQRVAIARALSVRPAVLVADEAVSGLDVSIQAQVLNLLVDLRDGLGLTMVFISHDLGVVEYLSNRIAVMYLGRIVELGPASAVFRRAGHPYTQALIRAIPAPDPTKKSGGEAVSGDLPSAVNPPSGCVFRTRCPKAQAICTSLPPIVSLGEGHWAACHFAGSPAAGDPTNRAQAQPQAHNTQEDSR
jgi:oligopeptide/dipeptide ABC transporter ATP-binding protein